MENERKTVVNIALPISFVDKIDKERGQKARSEVLRNFLLENFDLNKLKTILP